MFREMREALGIAKPVDILDHIRSLPPTEQDQGRAKIQEIERRAMKKQKPQPGLHELMKFLDRRSVRKAICTRNMKVKVHLSLP